MCLPLEYRTHEWTWGSSNCFPLWWNHPMFLKSPKATTAVANCPPIFHSMAVYVIIFSWNDHPNVQSCLKTGHPSPSLVGEFPMKFTILWRFPRMMATHHPSHSTYIPEPQGDDCSSGSSGPANLQQSARSQRYTSRSAGAKGISSDFGNLLDVMHSETLMGWSYVGYFMGFFQLGFPS